MRTKKAVIVVIAALIIVAGLAFIFKDSVMGKGPSMTATTTASTATDGKKPAHQFDWTFTAQPDNATTGVPSTKVSFSIDGGATRDVGTFDGNCFTILGSAWEFQQNEASGAICYFAGGGTEIGVFNQTDGSLSVQKGDVDEGSAETPGTRGNFTELFNITL